MKRRYLAALIAAVAMGCAVWYGCSKDKDEELQVGTIYGTVTDFSTGQPVDNANVTLRPSGETTLTGSDGAFQFNDVESGDYTLSFSKNGYSDLNDDYTLTVSKGKNLRRDVQLNPLAKSLRITVDGRETDTLNFGRDPSVSSITINIVNNGTVGLEGFLSCSSDWFYLSSQRMYLSPGEGGSRDIKIKRSSLIAGDNIAYLYITSGSYSKTIVVKAYGLSVPVVSNPVLTNYTNVKCNAQSSVTNDGGWMIRDKGFEYEVSSSSSVTRSQSCGNGINNFNCQIYPGGYRILRVRAYADNGVYKGYSGWVENPSSK